MSSGSTTREHGNSDTGCSQELLDALRRQTSWYFLVVSLVLLLTGVGVQIELSGLAVSVPLVNRLLPGLCLWLLILYLIWRGLVWHPYQQFGLANAVTLSRAAGTVLIATVIPAADHMTAEWVWMVTVLAVLLLALDGVDGYLARRAALMSEFGARFDMEIDALLILTISIFSWQSGEMGVWIISLGLMRYGFVLAGYWLPPLRGRLYPSLRRKLVCVIQLTALCAILSPVISPPVSTLAGILAFICLAASFTRDIVWLLQNQSLAGPSRAHSAPGRIAPIDANP